MRVPIVLGNSGYYGTLAAIRSLGRAGVPVTAIDPTYLAPGRFSRFAERRGICPRFERTAQWVAWLLEDSRGKPKRAIYATSDAVAYALARHRDELSEGYHLLQPDLAAMMVFLDKGQLIEEARLSGIETPRAWLPRSRQDAERIARDLECQTVLVKPRSQLAVRNYMKGIVPASGLAAIMSEYDRMCALGAHDADFARLHPEVMWPMFQEYHPESADRVYNLTGFRDASGKHVALLAANKILQRPRRLGVGLCFEDAEVDRDLAARILRMCERINYYGAFEAEFIIAGDRALLIDFNPRFYNQIGFDIARGLDIPNLVYAAMTGGDEQLDQRMESFRRRVPNAEYAFCNRFQFNLTIWAQSMFGAMSREEAARWRGWRMRPGTLVVDAAYDPGDRLPSTIDAMQQVLAFVKHPRAFFRELALAD